MDEPLSNLDAKLRGQMRAELKRFHQDLNATVIYVTHDQLEAVTMADRMAVMNGGRLQQYDTPARVFEASRSTPSSPASWAVPAMNLLPAKFARDGDATRCCGAPTGGACALSPEPTRSKAAAGDDARRSSSGRGTARWL